MAGTTYSKFFWQDWQGDLELKLCCMGAQGWWMRLLCVAGVANDRGRVVISGRRPTPEEMRRITAVTATNEEILGWERELIAAKVCDVDADGVLVSRRQRRAADKAHPNVIGGIARAKNAPRKGGRFATSNSTSGHQRPSPATVTSDKKTAGDGFENKNTNLSPADQRSPPGTINHQPESINHQPLRTLDENVGRVGRLADALGLDVTTTRGGHRWIEQMIQFEQNGISFEQDMLPVITEHRAKGRIPRDLNSLAYFRKPFEAHKQAREIGAKIAETRAEQIANEPFQDTHYRGWQHRFEMWLDSGYWPARYAERPRSGKCRAPADLLQNALEKWAAQGGHPTMGFPARDNEPMELWKGLRDLRMPLDPSTDYGDGPLPGQANVIPLRKAQ